MTRLHRGVVSLLMAVALLAGCDDDDGNGPSGTTLTEAETAALTAALGNSGFFESSSEALLFPLVVGGATEYGSFTVPASVVDAAREQVRRVVLSAMVAGEFDASAFQAVVNLTVNGETIRFCESGLLGWSGLNTSSNTADELLLVGGIEEGATTCTDGLEGEVGDDADAAYYNLADDRTYFGTSGFARLDNADFGGSTLDCSTPTPFGDLDCSYQQGDMSGSFAFTAEDFFSEDGASVEFAETEYDLPAVRVELGGNLQLPLVRAGKARPFRLSSAR
ncbi:MAG: hypothetical protein MUC69_09310 [Gemmatimonadales bacterium]|jgi:hypothetical protein|nr:hypothetical protein [Gemmatimonadales bacterium]